MGCGRSTRQGSVRDISAAIRRVCGFNPSATLTHCVGPHIRYPLHAICKGKGGSEPLERERKFARPKRCAETMYSTGTLLLLLFVSLAAHGASSTFPSLAEGWAIAQGDAQRGSSKPLVPFGSSEEWAWTSVSVEGMLGAVASTTAQGNPFMVVSFHAGLWWLNGVNGSLIEAAASPPGTTLATLPVLLSDMSVLVGATEPAAEGGTARVARYVGPEAVWNTSLAGYSEMVGLAYDGLNGLVLVTAATEQAKPHWHESLFALDVLDGHLVWSRQMSFSIVFAPETAVPTLTVPRNATMNDTIAVFGFFNGGSINTFSAVWASDGVTAWNVTRFPQCDTSSSPVIDAASGSVVIGCPYAISAWNLSTGAQLWLTADGVWWGEFLAVGHGLVFAAANIPAEPPGILALSIADGSVVWNVTDKYCAYPGAAVVLQDVVCFMCETLVCVGVADGAAVPVANQGCGMVPHVTDAGLFFSTESEQVCLWDPTKAPVV
jgi:PQQ-like domain